MSINVKGKRVERGFLKKKILIKLKVITDAFIELCAEDFLCISLNSSNSIARQEIKAQREVVCTGSHRKWQQRRATSEGDY